MSSGDPIALGLRSLLAALASVVVLHGTPASGQPVDPPAEHFRLRQRLELPAIDSFARLSAAQRATLDRLQQASALELEVYALGERALIVLPPAHPAGELVLLWHNDRDRLTVRAADGWTHRLQREQLADVLDRATPAERTLEASLLESVADTTAAPGNGGPLRRGAWRLRARASYRPLALEASPWAIRLKLDLWTSPLGLEGGPSARTLLALALPLGTGRDGLLALDALAEQARGTPVGWRLKVVNESQPADRAPIWRTEVVDLGTAPMPERRFKLTTLPRRQGEPLRVSRQLPPPSVAGLQVVAPAQLASLRAPPAPTSNLAPSIATRGGGERDPALLVRNQSGTAALIYADGVLLGWVAGGRSFGFTGLPPGFYRVFAVSPTGARSWGPHDLYLPGTWTLPATSSSSGW